MIYNRKLGWLLFILTAMIRQVSIAQLQLSDPYDQFFLTSAQPAYTLKSIQLQNGMQLEYAEQGKSTGIPVIFLHGYTDSWRSFEEVLPMLPESVHAFVLSQRGHGNSDRPIHNYRAEDFASDVATFMKQLKIESAIIVGHSMGATIAQRFALDHPEMTRAIVLAGSFANFKNNAGIAEFKSVVNKIEDPLDFSFAYEFQKSTFFKPVSSSVIESYANESMKVPARVWKGNI